MKEWVKELCPELADWQAELIAEEAQKAVEVEQHRILRIVYEQLTPYGKTGECAWIGVKHNVGKKA